jgi:hypothetical protein
VSGRFGWTRHYSETVIAFKVAGLVALTLAAAAGGMVLGALLGAHLTYEPGDSGSGAIGEVVGAFIGFTGTMLPAAALFTWLGRRAERGYASSP